MNHYQSRQKPVIQTDINSSSNTAQLIRWAQRPKFATSYWEEEGTYCYQVNANSICVARRQDNDMINGTKLLNVTGMSRGKRDGILKNEKARIVVKVAPMHLKGVWIPFSRAKELALQFKITDILHPLFLSDPSIYLQSTTQTTEIFDPIQYPTTDTRCYQQEVQISTTDSFYNQSSLFSYPTIPTDSTFSFDTLSNRPQQFQQQQEEFDLYPF